MTPTCKDFPRLASRIQIGDGTYEEISNTKTEPKTHDVMNKIVRHLAVYFRDEEVANRAISSAGKTLCSKSGKVDYEKYSTELINGLGGDDSQVVRIIKSINQNIIAGALYNLKTGKLKEYPFQDSRGPESWRIHVAVRDNMVTVKHTRQELFMNIDGSFKWALAIRFSRNMSKLLSCQLLVVHLDLENKKDQEKLAKHLGLLYKSS